MKKTTFSAFLKKNKNLATVSFSGLTETELQGGGTASLYAAVSFLRCGERQKREPLPWEVHSKERRKRKGRKEKKEDNATTEKEKWGKPVYEREKKHCQLKTASKGTGLVPFLNSFIG